MPACGTYIRNPVAPLARALRGFLFLKKCTLESFFEEKPCSSFGTCPPGGFIFQKIHFLLRFQRSWGSGGTRRADYSHRLFKKLSKNPLGKPS